MPTLPLGPSASGIFQSLGVCLPIVWEEPSSLKHSSSQRPRVFILRVNSRGLGECESRHSISLLTGTTCTVFVATSTVTSPKPKSSSSISCSRTRFRPNPAASRTLEAWTVIEWRTPRLSKKETWQSRTGTRSIYHILLLFANRDTMLGVNVPLQDRVRSESQISESRRFALMTDEVPC